MDLQNMLETSQWIHIATEAVLFIALGIYTTYQLKQIKQQVAALEHDVAEIKNVLNYRPQQQQDYQGQYNRRPQQQQQDYQGHPQQHIQRNERFMDDTPQQQYYVPRQPQPQSKTCDAPTCPPRKTVTDEHIDRAIQEELKKLEEDKYSAKIKSMSKTPIPVMSKIEEEEDTDELMLVEKSSKPSKKKKSS
jgi:hypothetical protein